MCSRARPLLAEKPPTSKHLDLVDALLAAAPEGRSEPSAMRLLIARCG
jgi:hypothetical protein